MILRLITALLLCTFFCGAQNIPFRNYSVSDGLSSSEVYKAIQDSKGYMWFCTDAGVCRYDGYSFRQFTSEHGLPDNTIFNIYEDHRQRIWFFGMARKLAYYDPDSDTIVSIEGNNVLSNSIHSSVITSIYVDDADTLFVAYNFGDAFYKVPPANNYKNVIPIIFNETGWQFWSPKPKEWVWGVTGRGLLKYDGNEDKVGPDGMKLRTSRHLILGRTFRRAELESYTSNLGEQFRQAIPAGNRILFFDGGNVYQLENEKLSFLFYDADLISLYADKDQNIWLGTTGKGVSVFPRGDLSKAPVHYLENSSVSSVCQDREGGYWFTTLNHGVFYTPSLSFGYYNAATGLSGEKVYSITPFHDSILCFTENRIMNSISKQHGVRQNRFLNGVKATVFGERGNILIITDNKSYCYDAESGERRFLKVINKGVASDVYIRKLIVSEKNEIYALYSLGLSKVDVKNARLVPMGPPFRRASSLYVKGDSIWIGLPQGLILNFAGISDTLGRHNPLLYNRIDDIKEDKRHWIWMATKGAGLIIKKGSRLQRIQTKDGLASNLCKTVLIDGDKTVWVGTNHGISKITLSGNDQFSIENYSSTDGLLSDEINDMCILNNELYVASNRGVAVFDRVHLKLDKVQPPVYLTSFVVNEKIHPLKGKHVLMHDENFIRFEYIGLSYKSPGKMLYKYRLAGLDTTWHFTSNQTVQYTTLPPGDYTFLVYAINSDMVNSAEPARILFTIRQPFWRAWWFILGLAIVLTGTIYGILRTRIHQFQQKEREKTEMEKKIARIELKAIRAQMNPHFIFNAINSIQHYVLTNDSESAYRYLSKFSKLIRNVLENSRHEIIPLQKEIETIELYIELEKLRFETRFTHTIYIDPAIDVLSYGISPLLIQPYVENAIWHGLMHKRDVGHLALSFIDGGNYILCVIDDNGVGRKMSEKIKEQHFRKHHSMALSLNIDRLEIIGHLFQNKQKVTIVDKRDAAGEALGTRVEIVIPKINFKK
ncbi:MAG: histidine kinase [Bacteroidetes bacterium]|nr:histidine kinase [Bacteroidota bacterium]